MQYLLFHTHTVPFTTVSCFYPDYFIGTEAYGTIMSMYASPNNFWISWQALIKYATRIMSLGHPTFVIFSFLPSTMKLWWEIIWGQFNTVRTCTSQPHHTNWNICTSNGRKVVIISCSHNYVLITCVFFNICYRFDISRWLAPSSAVLHILNCDMFPIYLH